MKDFLIQVSINPWKLDQHILKERKKLEANESQMPGEIGASHHDLGDSLKKNGETSEMHHLSLVAVPVEVATVPKRGRGESREIVSL